MSYEQASHLVQIGGLLFFVAAFALVLAYTLWPSNRRKFNEAARIPLTDEALGKDGTIPERKAPAP